MENLSREDISIRIDRLKSRVRDISSNLKKYNEELDTRYEFAKELGIKKDEVNTNVEVLNTLELYLDKASKIQEELNNSVEDDVEKIKLLNNMLYLDDVRFGSISELIEENKEIYNRDYLNKIVQRANQLIRNEELNEIDKNIVKLSKKSSFIDKITGRDKVKKVLLENYSLKRNETMNKRYIPDGRSILEIIDITKNCGFESESLNNFINKLSSEYDIDVKENKSLAVISKKEKIPFFYNKDYVEKISIENENMMEKIEASRSKTKQYKEFEFSEEALINGISSLELFGYEKVIDEVV